MATETENMFDKATQVPADSDLFAGDIRPDVTARDLFAGDDTLFKALDSSARPNLLSQAAITASRTGRWFTPTHIILTLNILVISGVLIYFLIRPNPAPVTIIQQAPELPKPQLNAFPEPTLPAAEAQALEPSVSWRLADQLFQSGKFDRAAFVYRRLSDNLTPGIPADEWLRDLLALRIAQCLTQSDKPSDTGRLFTQALQSRSIVVRALAHYSLAFIEFHNEHYLAARQHAYQTIALGRLFEDVFSPKLESDCYFLQAESLTREILHQNNQSADLPGSLWADQILPEIFPTMDQTHLKAFLQNGQTLLADGILNPQVRQQTDSPTGAQWTSEAMEAPFVEWINRFAAQARLNVTWASQTEQVRSRPICLLVPGTSEQSLAEIAAGSAGLIAEYAAEGLTIQNPSMYDNLNDHRQILTREAIFVWRRFLLRNPGDHRCPNAHFAMGLLQETLGESVAALGEYKLMASQFAFNPLTPHALLNSSRIKTGLQDYTGARADLTELIVQYPECKLIDQASLGLAHATARIGRYDEALTMFRKVFNLDLNKESRRDAAYGAADCYDRLGRQDEAKKWYIQAIRLTPDLSDHRIYTAYLNLGKALIALNDYDQAAVALRQAFQGPLTTEEFVETVLQLTEAQTRQERFVPALNMLEKIPDEKLTPDQSCRVLMARTSILREINLADTALSLLHRKLEFVNDPQLRGRLTVEIAKCNFEVGELARAQKNLSDALVSLSPGPYARQASLLLIDINQRLGQYDQAKLLCLQFLNQTAEDLPEYKRGLALLGEIYTKLKEHDKAAMAFVGVFDKLNPNGAGS